MTSGSGPWRDPDVLGSHWVTRKLHVVPSRDLEPQDEAIVDFSDQPPLLAEGVYQARLLHHETAMVFGTPKVFLVFEIVDPGQALGARVYRPYRVQAFRGKPCRRGSF